MEAAEKYKHSECLTRKMRLRGKSAVKALFESGSSFFQYPFKVVIGLDERKEIFPLRMLVSVSKRNFKNASDRNKIKRQTREAWRRQKGPLLDLLISTEKGLIVGLIFTSKNILASSEIDYKIKRILERLMHDYEIYKKPNG